MTTLFMNTNRIETTRAISRLDLRKALTVILLGIPPGSLSAYTTVAWEPGSCLVDDMTNATYWSPSGVPTVSDNATFPSSGSCLSGSPFYIPTWSSGAGTFREYFFTTTDFPYTVAITGCSSTIGGGTGGGVRGSPFITSNAFHVSGASTQLIFADGADTNTACAITVTYNINTGSLTFNGSSGDNVGGGNGYINLQDSTATMNLLLTGISSLVRVGALLGASGSTIYVATDCSLNFDQDVGGTFAGNISGGGAIVKEGSTTATLTGTINLPATAVAGIQVTGGLLQIEGTTTGSALITSTAELQVLNAGTLSGNVTVNSTAAIGFDISSLTASSLTIGDLNGISGSTINLGSKTLITGTSTTTPTVIGVIEGSGGGVLQKIGTGTLSLTGQSIHIHGGTIINAGTLAIKGDGSLGAPATAVTITGNSILEALAAFSSTARQISLGANTLTFNTDGHTVTWNGQITGTGGLTKNGTNSSNDILILGVNTNNYSGSTIIDKGTLAQGILNGFSPDSSITMHATGTLSLNGFDATVPSVGGVVGSLISLGANTLTVNSPTVASIYSGTITGTGENLIIGDSGDTTSMTLSNSGNAYTGTTTVANGTLTAGAANVISTSSELILGSGTASGTFKLNGYNNSIQQLTGNSAHKYSLAPPPSPSTRLPQRPPAFQAPSPIKALWFSTEQIRPQAFLTFREIIPTPAAAP